MDKRSKRILWALVVAIITIIIVEIVRPKPINWKPSYTAVDKIPFGGYVLFNELEDFYTTPVEQINKDPYLFLRDSTYQEKSVYFFVNEYLYFDKRQHEKLSNYVAQGNTVFLSARYFDTIFKDSLNIDTYVYSKPFESEILPRFYNPNLKQDSTATFKKNVYEIYFTSLDTLNTTALGYYKSEDVSVKKLNFIKVKHGNGFYFFHTLPEAFSNYYLLKESNQRYLEHVLSYLNPSVLYWDNYLKAGRKIVDSPMRFVLSQTPLKWAYYITIVGLLLFVLFKGKREQRIIKVVEPLKNSSIEFTKTIGDLHFQHKDFNNIIAKKITYFLEKVRTHYYLDLSADKAGTQRLDASFIEKLSAKSGNSIEKTNTLIQTINNLKKKSFHTETDLITLNKLLEEFNN